MSLVQEFTVRDATLNDLPRIVEIYNESIPGRLATADLDPVTVEQRRTWFEKHSPEHRPLWIAESGQGMVGWLSFESFYGRPAYDATAEISIYVSSAAQRCGAGKRLLEQAIVRAPQLGIRTLLGFVFAHNAPSIALFEKFGFVAWGQYPGIAVLDGIERSLTVVGRRAG
jgi:L-amino acid N-acyltransferase YncA